MKYVKEEALKRCAEHNSKDGWLYKLLEQVLNATYPAGTNIALVFIDAVVKRGLPYVSLNWQTEKGADCAEWWRFVIYTLFGKDPGNSSRSQAANTKLGVRISDRTKMRELDLMYLDLKSDSTAVSHVMGCVSADGKLMVHTTQVDKTTHDLRYQDREYYMKKYGEHVYKWCMRFVTDEELASVIMKNTESEEEPMTGYQEKTPRVFNAGEQAVQQGLIALGYSLPKYGADGKWGDETNAAFHQFQADYGVPQSNVYDMASQTAMAGALAKKTTDSVQAAANAEKEKTGLQDTVNTLQNLCNKRDEWMRQYPA